MKVAILLSSYNGAQWLPAQLDSLLRQSHRDWTLRARDDGSSDETPAVLRGYAARDPRVRVVADAAGNLGPCRSFSRLLEQAEAESESGYFMFCDQDDVWDADKIETTLAAMKAAEEQYGAHTPLLVHTDLRLVDQRLALLHPSAKSRLGFRRTSGDVFPRLLAQNFVTGCTVMINRPLARAAAPIPEAALMHDWWLALIAAALGRIAFIPRATVDYRQHATNASGVNRRRPFAAALAGALGNPLRYRQAAARRLRQAAALEAHLSRFPATPAASLLSSFLAAARRGSVPGLFSALRHGIEMQGPARTAVHGLALLACLPCDDHSTGR